jgi:hypothetical protein
MQTDHMKNLLRNAVIKYIALPFEYYSSLNKKDLFEEFGLEGDRLESDYCQIEVCLLDRFMENNIEVLHVPITARDGYQEFGVDLFFYSNGRVRWDEKLYEFLDGIPYSVDDETTPATHKPDKIGRATAKPIK